MGEINKSLLAFNSDDENKAKTAFQLTRKWQPDGPAFFYDGANGRIIALKEVSDTPSIFGNCDLNLWQVPPFCRLGRGCSVMNIWYRGYAAKRSLSRVLCWSKKVPAAAKRSLWKRFYLFMTGTMPKFVDAIFDWRKWKSATNNSSLNFWVHK